ncbi:MAG TPA: hypothetical protein VF260_06800 [Bacilli bacterium]
MRRNKSENPPQCAICRLVAANHMYNPPLCAICRMVAVNRMFDPPEGLRSKISAFGD